MRSLFLPVLLSVFCFLAASESDGFAHHGGYHPAWEVDEFEDEAFTVGSAQATGTKNSVLLGLGLGAGTAGGLILLFAAASRMPTLGPRKVATPA